MCGLFFHIDGEYNVGKSIDNTITLIENAALFAMPHFDEIYLSLSRTSNRYEDDYVIIKGNNQTINIAENSDLSITFSFDYYLFNESGILYIDGNEVSKDKYTISKGSSIITLHSLYLKSLKEGKHTIVAKLNGKEVEGNFSISKKDNAKEDNSSIKVNKNGHDNNPQTGDNVMFYIEVLGLSIIGLAGAGLYIRKRILN